MGLDFGLSDNSSGSLIVGPKNKKKWRWLFMIPDVCAQGVNSLPPLRSARPDLKWKEFNVQHVSEEVYYPGKPDWSTIAITMFDVIQDKHPVFEWLKKKYDPEKGKMYTPIENGYIKDCSLNMLDGCGNKIESWIFEDAWAQSMNFQQLDMGSNEYMLCDITLRFARAYIST